MISKFHVLRKDLVIGLLADHCGLEAMFQAVHHLVAVGLHLVVVSLSEYVSFLGFSSLTSLVFLVSLLVLWRSGHISMSGIRWQFSRGYWKETTNFYNGLFEFCTIVFVYFGILLSHMGMYWVCLVWNFMYNSCMVFCGNFFDCSLDVLVHKYWVLMVLVYSRLSLYHIPSRLEEV